MEDRHEEVLKQYNIEIRNTYRVRGAYIIEAKQGLMLYRNYEGSENKIEFEQFVKEHIYASGYKNIDRYVRNQAGELISTDTMGYKYVVKEWFLGDECNLKEISNISEAVRNLAKLHRVMQQITVGEDMSYSHYIYNLEMQCEKHNRELKRVRSYIRDKKQKNEFEVCFLGMYDEFYKQGIDALDFLQKSGYQKRLEQCVNQKTMCHGNYIYHNILMTAKDIATTNFEKVCIGTQVYDLYCFIRKVMEKNNWNIYYGDLIIEEYNKILPLSIVDVKILYALLLYPEKFWKVTNFYFNARKSWVPRRNIQKLVSLSEQAGSKDLFLKRLEQMI